MVATRQHTSPYPPPEMASKRGIVRKTIAAAARKVPSQPTRSISRSKSRSRSRSRSQPPQSASSSTSPTTSVSRSLSSDPGSWTHRPSPIIMLWLFISIPLVLWDTCYIYLRPYSMPGGPLHFLWKPYGLYGEVDFMYGWPEYRAGNGFPAAQSTLNVLEVLGYLYYLATVYEHSEVKREAYYFASEILNALQTVTGVPAKEKTRRIKML
ncbi:hypothetical protein KEM54_005639 [Ascosphaera aggregata]|nr:hypothetical protein KEM54_005639 [Ascosphaera aggregata]